MNREAEIRRFFTEHHPETRFVTSPPNEAGFWFAHEPDSIALFPIVHVFTLFDRTCHLDDDDFQLTLRGFGEIVRLAEIFVGRNPLWAPQEMLDWVRDTMIAEQPAMAAVIEQVMT